MADRVDSEPLLHVVLHQPEIPQNTGNIGRTCLAVGAKLWLVRPLGFRLDERYLLRAGMDYWSRVNWEAVDNWSVLHRHLAGRSMWFIENTGTKAVWDAAFQRGDVIVLGSESQGLPPSLLRSRPDRVLQLPMTGAVRSLNLASTAAVVVYEAVRQLRGEPPGGELPGGELPGGELPGGELPGGELPGGELPT
jgi:tRNA (cytidine/uridine-2'-O-)-methyltransferase